MKIYAVPLFLLLSILPLSAMDFDGKRLFDGRQKASGRSKKSIRFSSAENIDPEGTNDSHFGGQSEEDEWSFIFSHYNVGSIKNMRSGEICQLLIAPELNTFFSYAKCVMGTAVIKNNGIKVQSVQVFKKDGFGESMDIDYIDPGSWLALGNTIHAAPSLEDGQKPID
jgi:hypothetical protein